MSKMNLPAIRKISVDVPSKQLSARDPAVYSRRMDQLLREMQTAVDDINAAADAWNQNVSPAMPVIGRRAVEDKLDAMSAEEIQAVSVAYDDWSGDSVQYSAGEILSHNKDLFRVTTPHTSAPDKAPDKAKDLFAKL